MAPEEAPGGWRPAAAPLPRPRAGADLLKASHFALGPEPRLHRGALRSAAQRHFPAHAAAPRAPTAPPPSAALLPGDAARARAAPLSEAHRAFPPPAAGGPRAGRARGLQAGPLGARAGVPTGVPTARRDFGWVELPARAREQLRGARLIFDRDSVPPGDPGKLRVPPTTYAEAFPPRDARPQRRTPLGSPNPLEWDGGRRDRDTSYRTQFQARPGPPALMCKRDASSVDVGDARLGYGPLRSEQKLAYRPQGPPPDRYDRARALAHTHRVAIQPRDGLFRSRTSMAEHFPAREPASPVLLCDQTPPSHILEGDGGPGPGSLTTAMRFFHGQPPAATTPPGRHQPHEKLQTHVVLGQAALLGQFFQTTMGTDYRPPAAQQPQKAPNLHLLHSNLPEGTGELDFLTTNQKMLTPHRAAPAAPTEAMLQRCRSSHVAPPLGSQRVFSTRHREDFACKYQGPAVLRTDSCQESHVPLGTPHPWGGGAGPAAPQAPLYPCPSRQ